MSQTDTGCLRPVWGADGRHCSDCEFDPQQSLPCHLSPEFVTNVFPHDHVYGGGFVLEGHKDTCFCGFGLLTDVYSSVNSNDGAAGITSLCAGENYWLENEMMVRIVLQSG